MRCLALAILLSTVPGLAAAASFDLAALRTLPDIAALEAGCAPSKLGFAMPLPSADLLTEVAKLPADRKALAWLLFLHRLARDRDPMEFSLREPASGILEQMGAAMRAAGLGGKAALLDRATSSVTSFGALLSMRDVRPPAAFGTKATFAAAIVAYVRRTPALAACLATARATLPDDVRLGVLDEALAAAFAAGADPKTLPRPYRVVWLANQYVGEVDNGGIEQFFSNSSGDDVPETVGALLALELPDQATVVGRGMTLFGSPFPTDRAERLARERELGLAAGLDALTSDADTRAVASCRSESPSPAGGEKGHGNIDLRFANEADGSKLAADGKG